jgi:hypothetical protein
MISLKRTPMLNLQKSKKIKSRSESDTGNPIEAKVSAISLEVVVD